MRNLFVYIVIGALVTSCSSDEPEIKSNNIITNSYNIDKRSLDEALEIADKCAGLNSNTYGRATETKTVNKNTVTCLTRHNSRSFNDTLIYAIDYKDNEGYILVSANKNTEPVLAIIDKGSFSDEPDFIKCGYDLFIDKALDYVETAASPDAIIEPSEDFIMLWKQDTLALQDACPEYRLDVEWGQYWPENMFCPNKIAGGTPVAIAQFMSYFNTPVNIPLTFDGAPFDFLSVDWNELKKHNKSTGYIDPTSMQDLVHGNNCVASNNAHITLGALIRQLGVIQTSTYRGIADGSDRTYTRSAYHISEFAARYMANLEHYAMEPGKFYEALKDGGIGIVEAEIEEEEFYNHDWLADGVTKIDYTITTYYNYNVRTKEYTSKTVEHQTHNYIHYNWGMHGRYNGWFLDGVFDLEKGKKIGLNSRADFTVSRIVNAYVYK
ncbi:MAG: C10 family peptidase [Muribaculaceae bacterium]|nr:C10 family peptidase [Muribaculaceae bacterium]